MALRKQIHLAVFGFLAALAFVAAGRAQTTEPASNIDLQQVLAIKLAQFHEEPVGSPNSDTLRNQVIDLATHFDGPPPIPEDATSHFNTAMATLQKDPYDEVYISAIKDFTAAVQAAPWWPTAYYNLALTQGQFGRLGPAVQNLRFFLRLDPNSADAGTAQAKIGEWESALAETPGENSLGMRFKPVAGTEVEFSIWDTRVMDYAAFVKATNREWHQPKFPQGPTHPAVYVSWDDAHAFCDWLTTKDRTEGWMGLFQRYQLPTDAEWSVAVGLGPETGEYPKDKMDKSVRLYPWGTQWPPIPGAGNYGKINGYVEDFAYTSPVGSFTANRFGLYDMGGNVWQWCEDLYEPRQNQRVLRGCSWRDLGVDLLLANARSYGMPDSMDDYIGFRCVAASTLP